MLDTRMTGVIFSPNVVHIKWLNSVTWNGCQNRKHINRWNL